MKSFLLICTTLLLMAVPLHSQDLNRDSVPNIHVYTKNIGEIPIFPGGRSGLQRFVAKHFVYPAEAWQDTSSQYSNDLLSFVVRRDGVACGLKGDKMHPAVYKEWQRLFSFMPLWEPATIRGMPVDVRMGKRVFLTSRHTGFPFSVDRMVKALGSTIDQNRNYRKGIVKESAESMAMRMREIVDITPENVEVASPLARLNVSLGRYDEAVDVAGKSLKGITRLVEKMKKRKEEDPWFYAQPNLILPTNSDGQYYIDAALVYALVCDAAGLENETEEAYRHALDVIDERIYLKDVRKRNNRDNNNLYRSLAIEKRDLAVLNSRTSGNQLNRSEREDVYRHGWVGGENMDKIDKAMKEGKVDNPRLRQISTHMKEIEEESRYRQRSIGKDSLYLYGLRAMVLELSGGQQAVEQYIEYIHQREDVGKKLKSYMAKLAEKRQQHAETLENREMIVHSLASLAPVSEEGTNRKERKQEAKEFYKYRDAMADVYPLEWLWKTK